MNNTPIIQIPVSSVNGLTGTVVLDANSIGAAEVTHTHLEADITDLKAYLTDAPVDGNRYGRKDGLWVTDTDGFLDAPSNNILYARRNLTWEQPKIISTGISATSIGLSLANTSISNAVTIPSASTSLAGLMSSADKDKLNNVPLIYPKAYVSTSGSVPLTLSLSYWLLAILPSSVPVGDMKGAVIDIFVNGLNAGSVGDSVIIPEYSNAKINIYFEEFFRIKKLDLRCTNCEITFRGLYTTTNGVGALAIGGTSSTPPYIRCTYGSGNKIIFKDLAIYPHTSGAPSNNYSIISPHGLDSVTFSRCEFSIMNDVWTIVNTKTPNGNIISNSNSSSGRGSDFKLILSSLSNQPPFNRTSTLNCTLGDGEGILVISDNDYTRSVTTPKVKNGAIHIVGESEFSS